VEENVVVMKTILMLSPKIIKDFKIKEEEKFALTYN